MKISNGSTKSIKHRIREIAVEMALLEEQSHEWDEEDPRYTADQRMVELVALLVLQWNDLSILTDVENIRRDFKNMDRN